MAFTCEDNHIQNDSFITVNAENVPQYFSYLGACPRYFPDVHEVVLKAMKSNIPKENFSNSELYFRCKKSYYHREIPKNSESPKRRDIYERSSKR